MKNITKGCIALLTAALCASCKGENYDGTYVASIKGEFSIADDTLIIKGDIVTKSTGYKRIINGKLKPKEWSVKKWIFNTPYGPIIELGDHQVTLGSTTYKKIK